MEDTPTKTDRPVQRFTFGVKYADEPHPMLGKVDPMSYVEISGATVDQGRALMAAIAGTAWAFQYTPEEWAESRLSREGPGPCITIRLEDLR